MNKYYTSYNETNKRIDYLKYGLLNPRGIAIDKKILPEYNENAITKIK